MISLSNIYVICLDIMAQIFGLFKDVLGVHRYLIFGTFKVLIYLNFLRLIDGAITIHIFETVKQRLFRGFVNQFLEISRNSFDNQKRESCMHSRWQRANPRMNVLEVIFVGFFPFEIDNFNASDIRTL